MWIILLFPYVESVLATDAEAPLDVHVLFSDKAPQNELLDTERHSFMQRAAATS